MNELTCAQESGERTPVADAPLSSAPKPWYVSALIGAFAFQAALLVVAGLRNREMINPDAVSYVRTASYYLHERLDLAVNGYWGPLLSWIMAPLLPLFHDPLGAARVAMALSAVLFLAGCVSVFRAFGLGRPAVLAGTWLAAIASVAWSVTGITSDLLLAGLLALGCSFVLAPSWPTRPRAQVAAGLLLGAAYLAKAIAFPFTFLFLIAMLAMQLVTGRAAPRTVLWAGARTMAAFAVIAAPWVIVLSLHYGRPVFSTSSAAAHAVAGPDDLVRLHPTFTAWLPPTGGRITTWEEPSLLPYRSWSPFESLAYARHQARLIQSNFQLAYETLARLDLVGIGLIVLVAAFLFHRTWRANMLSHPWRWAGVPVACLMVWYLPVYFMGEARYCWPAYPFILGAGLGMTEWLTAELARRRRLLGALALVAVVVAFAAPAGKATTVALLGKQNPDYVCARELRARQDAAGLTGPIASIGPDERVGLYLAFLRDEPWYGDNLDPSPHDFKSAAARLYIIDRHSPLRGRLDAQEELQDLDSRLFASPAQAAACPVVVYGAK